MEQTTIIIIAVIMCLLLSSSIGGGIGAYYYNKNKADKTKADKTDADKTDADKTDADKTDADKTDTNTDNKPTTQTVIGCEADSATFKCSASGIKSGTIKYGRYDNTTCPHSTVSSNTPSGFKTYPLKAGTTSIPNVTSSYLGDDPLPNIFKQFSIDYICN